MGARPRFSHAAFVPALAVWLGARAALAQGVPAPDQPPAPPAPAATPGPAAGPARPGPDATAAPAGDGAGGGLAGPRRAAGEPPVTPAREPEDTPRRQAFRGEDRDAHADRIVVLPTAYTHPEGTFYVGAMEIVLLQFGYAFTDSLQGTITAIPIIPEEGAVPLDLSLKLAPVQSGPVRTAVIGSISGIAGIEDSVWLVGRFTATAQLCFDEPCGTTLAFASGALMAGPATLVLHGAGLTYPMADWAKLLLEFEALMPLGREVGEFHGAALTPGFRFAYRRWALDLALIKPFGISEPPVVPWLAFTWRTEGDAGPPAPLAQPPGVPGR